MKRYLYIVVALCALSATFSVAAANVTVKAKLDSTNILMGKQTTLHIQTVQDKNAIGHFTNETADTLSANIEVIKRLKPDTTDLDNGRIQIDRALIIQSFDSGMWTIPQSKYVVGKDTFKSQELYLKVIPVPVDTLKSIHDFKGVEEPPFNMFDWLPDFITDYWWIYIIMVILCGVGALIYFITKKKRFPLMPKKKEIPPYEEAIHSLQALKEQKLWQSGNEKEYYTRLTDILRTYIDRRFQINAMEMTSSQIIDILKKNEETKAVNEQLKQILEIADYVKFAKERPLPDDNEVAYVRAVNFVEETKPVVVAQPENEGDVATDVNNKDNSPKNKK